MRTMRKTFPAKRILLRYFHAYRQVFFYALLFLAGVLSGALLLKNLGATQMTGLFQLVQKFAQRREQEEFLKTFFSSFTTQCLPLLVVFLCGFCAVAQPLIVLLPYFRGLGFGFQAGCLYTRQGAAGVGYAALLLLPNLVFSTLVLIWGCAEAFSLSNAFYRAVKQERTEHLVNLRVYCGRFLLLLILSLFCALLDALCTFCFSGFFHFT